MPIIGCARPPAAAQAGWGACQARRADCQKQEPAADRRDSRRIGVLGVLDGVPGLVDAVAENSLSHVCVCR